MVGILFTHLSKSFVASVLLLFLIIALLHLPSPNILQPQKFDSNPYISQGTPSSTDPLRPRQVDIMLARIAIRSRTPSDLRKHLMGAGNHERRSYRPLFPMLFTSIPTVFLSADCNDLVSHSEQSEHHRTRLLTIADYGEADLQND
jgi:hypothetical protein